MTFSPIKCIETRGDRARRINISSKMVIGKKTDLFYYKIYYPVVDASDKKCFCNLGKVTDLNNATKMGDNIRLVQK